MEDGFIWVAGQQAPLARNLPWKQSQQEVGDEVAEGGRSGPFGRARTFGRCRERTQVRQLLSLWEGISTMTAASTDNRHLRFEVDGSTV
jgi:hypothetical protein